MNQPNRTTQANGETDTTGLPSHVIEVEEEWLTSMEAKISQPPKLLNLSAGKRACCIFRIPQSQLEVNKNAYQPHMVSIGPYHNGREHLQKIEEHKGRYLGAVLARVTGHRIILHKLFQAIASEEDKIRECYSETIQSRSHQLIGMMVLDGCFILELFHKLHQLAEGQGTDGDPILNIAWLLPHIARDLLMLENQIPFFVLETLFNHLKIGFGENVPSLNWLALNFFNSVIGTRVRPNIEKLQSHEEVRGEHILDLYRLSLIPTSVGQYQNEDVKPIPSAQKLHLADIKFRAKDADGFVDISFSQGVLEIPPLMLDNFCTFLFLNCVAFEQSLRHKPAYITTYAFFMGCLITTSGDAGFLRDRKIIESYLGADEKIALFFNNMGKDMTTDISESYLTKVFVDVNKYISNNWRVHWAEFKNTYFGTRWSFISAVAASLLLAFTLIQAFFAVYAFVKPPKGL